MIAESAVMGLRIGFAESARSMDELVRLHRQGGKADLLNIDAYILELCVCVCV